MPCMQLRLSVYMSHTYHSEVQFRLPWRSERKIDPWGKSSQVCQRAWSEFVRSFLPRCSVWTHGDLWQDLSSEEPRSSSELQQPHQRRRELWLQWQSVCQSIRNMSFSRTWLPLEPWQYLRFAYRKFLSSSECPNAYL
jgi:hypothetical protein